jgi:uncharacterized Ntn-hydrolase superfamily protein
MTEGLTPIFQSEPICAGDAEFLEGRLNLCHKKCKGKASSLKASGVDAARERVKKYSHKSNHMSASFGRLSKLSSTFSIVAYDPQTKDLGVGVQSRYFSVGSAVPWAKARVGAVATQSFVNFTYGPKGLALLEQGFSVYEVLDHLTKEDEGRDFRQVGVIDAKGNAASYTGKNCLDWAGSRVGRNYAAQGNILAGREVVDRMAEMFESTQGSIEEKIIAALKGGEEGGGDARGRQSSSILVVRKDCKGEGIDRLIDLRVEDNEDPIGELQRLVVMHRVYDLIDEGEELMTKGRNDEAIRCIEKAIALNPRNDDAFVDLGMINLKMGRKDEAITALKTALEINPKMKNLILQLPKTGSMDPDLEIMRRIGIQ